MAKVVMTEYPEFIAPNKLVFPECPYAKDDFDYPSLEVHCVHPDCTDPYCSDNKNCPFNK